MDLQVVGLHVGKDHVKKRLYIRMCIYIYFSLSHLYRICVYNCVYVCVYTYVYVCVYVYVYVCVYVYIYYIILQYIISYRFLPPEIIFPIDNFISPFPPRQALLAFPEPWNVPFFCGLGENQRTV